MSEGIDITGIDHGALLAALHNNAMPLGMGWLHARGDMTAEEGTDIVNEHRSADGHAHFDYVFGRPLKVSFEGNVLRGAWLYDRDQGDGACQRVVDGLRKTIR